MTFTSRSQHLCRACLALVLLGLLLQPTLVLADAPSTRGEEPPSIGGTGQIGATSEISATDELAGSGTIGSDSSGFIGSVSSGTSATWAGVQPLPPPALALRAQSGAPLAQQGDGNGALAWLDRTLNPGNWILDAGMGIFAGIIKMFGGMAQKAAQSFLGSGGSNSGGTFLHAQNGAALDGSWSVIPAGCTDAATNFVFCTPAELTYDHPGVQAVWAILQSIAFTLATILFVVRIGRLLPEGSRGLTNEAKVFPIVFLVALVFIYNTYWVGWLLVGFFNGISDLLLSRASLALPAQDVGDLNIGSNILFLVLWVVILWLAVKGLGRLVQIIVLLAIAPIAGALLLDRSTAPRFRSWLEKLLELLFAPINLAIIFTVIASILQPFLGQASGDAFTGFLLAITMIGMAIKGQSMIGIAGAAAGAGGGVVSYLGLHAAGRMMRGVTRGRAGASGASSGASRGGGGTDPQVREATDQTRQAAEARRRESRTSGDPAQSAAAQRQHSAPSVGASGSSAGAGTASANGSSEGGAARRAGSGAFRMSASGDSYAGQRARKRYQAARSGQSAQTPGGPAPDARREQARMRGTLMRRQAREQRRSGDHVAANTLERKAKLQTDFARGKHLARPSRFTSEQRSERRQAYREALAEVQGAHALERDKLMGQMEADQQRQPILQRELAMAGTSGAATATLHREQRAIQQRLQQNQARLSAITPDKPGQVTRVARQAATALANQRLPAPLRSAQHAVRASVANGSAFAKQIAGAGVQEGLRELARARATAASTAATPPDARPPISPISPPRRQNAQRGTPQRATAQGAAATQRREPPRRQNAQRGGPPWAAGQGAATAQRREARPSRSTTQRGGRSSASAAPPRPIARPRPRPVKAQASTTPQARPIALRRRRPRFGVTSTPARRPLVERLRHRTDPNKGK